MKALLPIIFLLNTVQVLGCTILNGGDTDYKNCILSADTSDTNFSIDFVCGDSTLYHFLRTCKTLDIISIRPNPAQDDIDIEINSLVKQVASIELRNPLGARVCFDSRNLAASKNSIRLGTQAFSSGMYLVW